MLHLLSIIANWGRVPLASLPCCRQKALIPIGHLEVYLTQIYLFCNIFVTQGKSNKAVVIFFLFYLLLKKNLIQLSCYFSTTICCFFFKFVFADNY